MTKSKFSVFNSIIIILISGCTTNNNLIRNDGRFFQISSNNTIFFEAEFLSTVECINNHRKYYGNLNNKNLNIIDNSEVFFGCSQYSEVRNLPFTGSAISKLTEQSNPVRFKSEKSCNYFINTPNFLNNRQNYSCAEPLHDGMSKDRYCAIEKRVGKENYGGIKISKFPEKPKVICD